MENHLIKQFIWEDEANKIGKEFMEFARYFRLPGDDFGEIHYTHALANYNPALAVLCDKTSLINKMTGTLCYPTYAFIREYQHGDVLMPHKDRAECEISVSCGKKFPQWPASQELPSAVQLLNLPACRPEAKVVLSWFCSLSTK